MRVRCPQAARMNRRYSRIRPSTEVSLVGGLMYTLITRPDVATAVSICARYVQPPREAHLATAKRILRFLHHTRKTPLVYQFCGRALDVKAFVDSSWGNDVDTRRSRFGYAIYVGKSLVAWCSKLHPALAISSAEAEYTAATEAVKAIKWIVSLMTVTPSIRSRSMRITTHVA